MDILRDFIRQDPKDADAFTGMAEAALALGNFGTARADFAEASALQPGNQAVAARQSFADSVVALDPGAARLDEKERTTRASALLTRAVAERERCLGVPYVGVAADSARSQLGGASAPASPERTDAMTRLAGSIWSTRPRCVGPFTPDDVLATVMRSMQP